MLCLYTATSPNLCLCCRQQFGSSGKERTEDIETLNCRVDKVTKTRDVPVLFQHMHCAGYGSIKDRCRQLMCCVRKTILVAALLYGLGLMLPPVIGYCPKSPSLESPIDLWQSENLRTGIVSVLSRVTG